MVRTIRAAGAAVLAAVALAGTAAGDEPAGAGPKTVPPGVPLTLTVTGKAKYTFDPAPLTAEAYKKAVEDAAKPGKKLGGFGGKALPAPPAVDLAVELKNTSDKALTVWAKGDPVVLTLNLAGKGAYNLDPPIAMTLEFRIPEAISLGAGKSHTFAVKQLKSGMRGATHWSYWTAPGEYDLTATLKTGVQPVPKGAMENDGFGMVTVTSPAFKLTVEGK